MTPFKVAVNGALGKMGSESVRAIRADSELELVGEFDASNDLKQAIQDCGANIVVDFTTAEFAFENTLKILQAGAHPVIGTTGFTSEQINTLTKQFAEQQFGGIIAPNFSVGAILMMRMAKQCAEFFPHVEIIELHHDRKADAPSGTSIKTAELIAENRTVPPTKVDEKEIIAGARGGRCHDIAIHSIRLPGLVAHQQVLFGGHGETLSIRHDSMNRECFMPGVILACKKVPELKQLVYGLENILF